MAINKTSKTTVKNYATMFEDSILKWGEAQDLAVRLEDGVLKWTEVVGDLDLPPITDVRDKVQFGNGLVGSLGRINEQDKDIAEQIRVVINDIMLRYLPSDWEELRYMNDVNKNDFHHNAKQYGVVIEQDRQVEGLLCGETIEVFYRIILTNDYVNHEDDLDQRLAGKELIDEMELIRRRLVETQAGTYQSADVSPVVDFSRDEPDYRGKLVVLEATFSVQYELIR